MYTVWTCYGYYIILNFSYSYRASLFNRIFLKTVMQCCRFVGKGESSASIGTAGEWDWCVVRGGHCVAMEKLRWPMDMFARETNRSPRPAERSDRRDKSETWADDLQVVWTGPPASRLPMSRICQDQYLWHSRRSRQQYWTAYLRDILHNIVYRRRCVKHREQTFHFIVTLVHLYSFYCTSTFRPILHFLPRDALVHSAVLRLHVVRLSVCLSVCDVGGSGSHRLEILETNCTGN